jgi:two-component system OmpR family response regulator
MASVSPPLHRVLVVDDDADIREQIGEYLTEHGYTAQLAANAAALDAALASQPVDLIILDVMLHGESGLSICRRLVNEGGPPIVMISALGDETDRVLGLEFGADDYLAKPFSLRELLARVRAVLRRRDDGRHAATAARIRTYRFEGLTADTVRNRLETPDGAAIPLTGGEFALLTAFLHSPQQVLSRDQLADAAHSAPADATHRGVDVQVSRLRRKLQGFAGLDIIRTYRGAGYLFDAQVTQP